MSANLLVLPLTTYIQNWSQAKRKQIIGYIVEVILDVWLFLLLHCHALLLVL